MMTGRRDLTYRVAELLGELREAQRTVAELNAVNVKLKQELADLRAERDGYLKSLYALTRQDFSFTQQELVDLESNGRTMEQVIAELENDHP
jgi:hypothetical protein